MPKPSQKVKAAPKTKPVAADDVHPTLHLLKATTLLEEGSLDAAKLSLEACLAGLERKGSQHKDNLPTGDESDELRGRALVLLGKIEDLQGHTVEAVELYKKSLQSVPSDIEALVLCAQALKAVSASQADLDLAEKCLREVIALSQKKAADATDDDGDEEEDEEEEEEEDEEEEARASDEALARLSLAQLLVQKKSGLAEADALLSSLGFQYRLSDDMVTGQGAAGPKAQGQPRPYVRVLDGALSPALVTELRDFFLGKDATFWREHSYDSPSTGYFSYALPLEPLQKTGAQLDPMERAVLQIHAQAAKHFPAVRGAKVAEWWAHCRPHSSGHQLHFDTDEHSLHHGHGIRTPCVSTVCYLGHDARVGGPTVVFDHKAGGGPSGGEGKGKGEGEGEAGLAREAVLVDPRENRLLAFDGSLLHGVLPGRGASPDVQTRRLTLMVGFWDEAEAREWEGEGQGPMRTRPKAAGWAQTLRAKKQVSAPPPEASLSAGRVVSPCWTEISTQGKDQEGASDDEDEDEEEEEAAPVDVKASGRFFLRRAGEVDEEMHVLLEAGRRRAAATACLEKVQGEAKGKELHAALEGLREGVEAGLMHETEACNAVLDAGERWMGAGAEVVAAAVRVLGAVVMEGGGGEAVGRALVRVLKAKAQEGEVGEEAVTVLCGLTGKGEGRVAGAVVQEGGVEAVLAVARGRGGCAAKEGAAAVVWNLAKAGALKGREGQVRDGMMTLWGGLGGGKGKGKGKEKGKKRPREAEEGEEELRMAVAGALAWVLVDDKGRGREGCEEAVRRVVAGGGVQALRSMAEGGEEEAEEAAERLERAFKRLKKGAAK